MLFPDNVIVDLPTCYKPAKRILPPWLSSYCCSIFQYNIHSATSAYTRPAHDLIIGQRLSPESIKLFCSASPSVRMAGRGRGRDMTLRAWMTSSGPAPPGPPSIPQDRARQWNDVDQIATAAVLQQQDAELRATLAQARFKIWQHLYSSNQ